MKNDAGIKLLVLLQFVVGFGLALTALKGNRFSAGEQVLFSTMNLLCSGYFLMQTAMLMYLLHRIRTLEEATGKPTDHE